MTRRILDTDTFSHYLRHHPAVFAAVLRHLSANPALTVVTVEELWDGWQAAVRKAKTPDEVARAYTRLTDTLIELRNWPLLPVSAAAVERYRALKRMKLNVGTNDLRIAALALELGATVVTANTRDFGRVPGLPIEDWTA